MNNTKLRVVKVGGSLLDDPDLFPRLVRFLDNPEWRSVVIAGCGPFADSLRDISALHDLSDEFCHEFCLDLMSWTARITASRTGTKLLNAFDKLARFADDRIVFDVAPWMRAQDQLPRDWTVTSDSIGAQLALNLGIQNLFLLKSRTPAREIDWDGVVTPFVDDFFPQISVGLTVHFVDFRTVKTTKN